MMYDVCTDKDSAMDGVKKNNGGGCPDDARVNGSDEAVAGSPDDARVNGSESESGNTDIVYKSEKDFYRGVSGEFRLKAEGLFKKAKEKGISIDEIDIATIRENQAEISGLGTVQLPAFIVKVKGRHVSSGQVMVDGKQIDYFNRYQRYVAEKIAAKKQYAANSAARVKEDGRTGEKSEVEFGLTDWEKFEIGKNLLDDKEFGLEKTITGACDRVIRKLMGENDWLYPEEARLLDEEFDDVQGNIAMAQKPGKQRHLTGRARKATERQINYLKAKIKNFGIDPEDERVMHEILRQNGFESIDLNSLTTVEASRIIDNVSNVIPAVKEGLTKYENAVGTDMEHKPQLENPGNIF